jgi:hypothetical protein
MDVMGLTPLHGLHRQGNPVRRFKNDPRRRFYFGFRHYAGRAWKGNGAKPEAGAT